MDKEDNEPSRPFVRRETTDDPAPPLAIEAQERNRMTLSESNNNSQYSAKTMEALEIEMGTAASNHDPSLEKNTAIIEQVSDQEIDALMEQANALIVRTEPQPQIDEDDHPIDRVQSEDSVDHDDMESLLGKSQANGAKREEKSSKGNWCRPCCVCPSSTESPNLGNIRVVSMSIYTRTNGWGVVGPHWFGPPCVVAILVFATFYFGYLRSWRHHWYGTAVTCFAFGTLSLYLLIQTAYQDPGVIRPGRLALPDPIPRSYRWCQTCDYHQPPNAAHCPDCNACIAGFDHHCVWMGTCIGAANFKSFMRFNLSWLTFLLYAILWVTIVAPLAMH